MLTAVDIKTQVQSDLNVETEIYLINVAILLGRDSNSSSVILNKDTVTSINSTDVTGSPMSLDTAYYSVWQGTVVDNWKTVEMNKVIDNFKKLGYTINRKSDDMEHLYWQITW